MRRAEVELWAMQVVDEVLAGTPIEDGRVELKREWPDPWKAARRIGGHLNAAHGEPVLWLIGVDEKTGPTSLLAGQDPASWWDQVCARFDQVKPEMSVHQTVHHSAGAFIALLIESDRAPYVIEKPKGQPGIDREVPWREGTAVRSAHRHDLVRLLAPVSQLPDVELLEASVVVYAQQRPRKGGGIEARHYISFRVMLFIEPTPAGPVSFPSHRCQLVARFEGVDEPVKLMQEPLRAPYVRRDQAGSNQLVDEPGKFVMGASREVSENDPRPYRRPAWVDLEAKMLPTGAGSPVVVRARLDTATIPPNRRVLDFRDVQALWRFEAPDPEL